MKIVYFSESLPPIRDGVAGTLAHLAVTLRVSGTDFRFYSPVDADPSLPWYPNIRSIASLPVELHRTYRMGMPYFQRLNRELDRYEPDLVHVVSPSLLGNFGIGYARRRNIPAVSSYHTNFISYFRYYRIGAAGRLGWSYLRWFYNRCSAVFAPSPSAAFQLRSSGIRNVELWQRGIDTGLFSPEYRSAELRRSIAVDDATPILLFVARLVKEKDLGDLAAAVGLLKRWGCVFKTVIVGDGPMRGELGRLMPAAHFTGYLHGKELARWYASSDMFVFPSTTETFGNVVLEASASGIPSVGADKGGVADIISPGITGLLARPNDPHDFAAKIRVLLDDPGFARRLGQHAKISSAQYDWHAINMNLIDRYKHLIGNSAENGISPRHRCSNIFQRSYDLNTAV